MTRPPARVCMQKVQEGKAPAKAATLDGEKWAGDIIRLLFAGRRSGEVQGITQGAGGKRGAAVSVRTAPCERTGLAGAQGQARRQRTGKLKLACAAREGLSSGVTPTASDVGAARREGEYRASAGRDPATSYQAVTLRRCCQVARERAAERPVPQAESSRRRRGH